MEIPNCPNVLKLLTLKFLNGKDRPDQVHTTQVQGGVGGVAPLISTLLLSLS